MHHIRVYMHHRALLNGVRAAAAVTGGGEIGSDGGGDRGGDGGGAMRVRMQGGGRELAGREGKAAARRRGGGELGRSLARKYDGDAR